MNQTPSQRFEVDTEGMRQLNQNRRPHELIKELIQNVFDEDEATSCAVEIKSTMEGVTITVTDDGAGFRDIKDAYTIMGETEKRRDPTKRGRFNLGEKEVVSVAIEATIKTVGHTIHFPKSGGRTITANRRRRGTQIQALMPWDTAEAAELADRLTHFRAPQHITFSINGTIPAASLLPTEPRGGCQQSSRTLQAHRCGASAG